MNNVTRSRNYSDLEPSDQNAIAEAIAVHGVQHMKIQAYGRSKLVCRAWFKALNSNNVPIIQRLQFCQPLFTPLFKRFILQVSQIDTTPNTKYCPKPIPGRVINIQVSQAKFEYGVYLLALGKDPMLYEFSPVRVASLDALFASQDNNLLLQEAKFLSTHFYKSNLPTICECRIPFWGLPPEQSRFSKKTIGTLLNQIEECNKSTSTSQSILDSYTVLRELILQYELLPIEKGNAALASASVGRKFNPAMLWSTFVVIICVLMALSMNRARV